MVNELIEQRTYKLTIVRIKDKFRCIYLNDYRIIGSKPYVSEGGEYKNYDFTLDDLRTAFPNLEIKEKAHVI
jgi:hypothetical protein